MPDLRIFRCLQSLWFVYSINKTKNKLNHTLNLFQESVIRSCQKATAAAVATLSESTPCAIGIRTT